MTDLATQVGQTITITGEAGNARMGAIVFTPDRTAVYLLGKEEWETENRQTVTVTGTLRSVSLAPNATVDKDGAVSHGMDGDSWVLEGATWTLDS
ncbi:MAG: hypothetical protein GY898_01060 [Proteobacteria bacterium]|nr:hypothetical protein [Pseudomonadota bacterium]